MKAIALVLIVTFCAVGIDVQAEPATSEDFLRDHNVGVNDKVFCGPLTLQMALALKGVEVSVEDIARAADITYRGTTLYGLKVAAEKHGLDAQVRKRNRKRIAPEQFPFVCHLPAERHFVLAVAGTEDYIVVYYPGKDSLVRMNWAYFQQSANTLILDLSDYSGTRGGYIFALLIVVGILSSILYYLFRVHNSRKYLLVSSVTGLCVISALPLSAYGADKKFFTEKNEIYLGTVLQHSEYEGAIKFENRGDEVLEIKRVKSSCVCSTAEPQKTKYAPGESGEIKFTIETGARQGPLSTYVFIETDTEAMSKNVVAIKLNVAPRLEIYPNCLIFPEKLAGSPTVVKTIRIRSELIDLFIEDIMTDSPVYRFEGVEKSEFLEGEYIARVSRNYNKVNDTHGKLSIFVKYAGDGQKLVIPMKGKTRDAVEFGGSQGRLGVLRAGRPYIESIPLYSRTPVDQLWVEVRDDSRTRVELWENREQANCIRVALEPIAAGEYSNEVAIYRQTESGRIKIAALPLRAMIIDH